MRRSLAWPLGALFVWLAPACESPDGPPIPDASGGSSGEESGGTSSDGGSGAGGSTGTGGALGGAPATLDCLTYGMGVETSRPFGTLDEASGLAASREYDRIYAHNDSGETNRLFVLDREGALLHVLYLDVAIPTDWEDMALDEQPGDSTRLILADIGDNEATRDEVSFVFVAEPAELSDELLPTETRTLSYPDGPHDAEAFFVDEVARRGYVLTKASPVGLYSFDLDDEGASLVHGGAVQALPAAFSPTGADLFPSEELFVVRSLDEMWAIRVGATQDIAELLLSTPELCPIEINAETSAGEAVAIGPGALIYTITESDDPLTVFTPE